MSTVDSLILLAFGVFMCVHYFRWVSRTNKRGRR